jgi:hypothetical protein
LAYEEAYNCDVFEKNHENIRALEGGRIHWHMNKAYIGKSEENHENIRA